MMTPHGPDSHCFDACTKEELVPKRVAEGTMVDVHAIFISHSIYIATFLTKGFIQYCVCKTYLYAQAFMFESCLSMAVTPWGLKKCNKVDKEYYTCWQGLKKNFDPNWKPA